MGYVEPSAGVRKTPLPPSVFPLICSFDVLFLVATDLRGSSVAEDSIVPAGE